MIKAVLFDLDHTLIETGRDTLSTCYFNALTAWFLTNNRNNLPYRVISDALYQATFQTEENHADPTRRNRDRISEYAAVLLGMSARNFEDAQATFHATSLADKLRGVFSPSPGAVSLLSNLQARDIKVVLACNALIPLDAMRQILELASLPKDYPFAFIPNADEMHFSKPNATFIEEILARTGIEPDEALLVGDHLENDIGPAKDCGVRTFQVGVEGTLADFSSKVSNGWLAKIGNQPATRYSIGQVIPRLLGNTAALYGMVDATPTTFWNQRPVVDSWTPLEIICHLRDAERPVQRANLELIVREDNPFLSQPNTLNPGQIDYSGEDPREVAAQFWAERRQTIHFLENLPAEAWSRPARHSIFGPTTLLEMALFIARHDRLHLNQLCQTVGRCKEE
ncbi:MAG: hypothetical protein OHK0023_08460 [Anaerolineae bacterium]